jgi:N-acyl homoserine lactone hydrolase
MDSPPRPLVKRKPHAKMDTNGGDARMSLEIKRLHLAKLSPPAGDRGQWPVHGFVITHPGGAVLVDTGVGGPEDLLNDWRVVNVSAADALAELDMSPADISLVINTHLHFDHCGQNAVFKHAPFYVQRAELDRARRESSGLSGWFDFMDARFELLDGDTQILPGLSVIATPGHTAGHQCVVVQTGDGSPDLLIGDAAYTPREYSGPLDQKLPPGQATDRPSWETSIERVHSMTPARVHFCHHTDIVHD